MATTTNYSWTTPDDTALVKDGAAAIRSLGTAIDTTVFNNAGAAVAKATVDAKGDLIAGTADNTIARLAVGADNTVLTADSNEATGLKWAAASAGGANWSLLNAGGTTLTGADTITISGISNKDKIMILIKTGSSASASSYFSVRVNGLSTNIYNQFGPEIKFLSAYAASNGSAFGFTDNKIQLAKMSASASDTISGYCSITGCATSGHKVFQSSAGGTTDAANSSEANTKGGWIETTAAITSVSLISSVGNFDAGTLYVYASA